MVRPESERVLTDAELLAALRKQGELASKNYRAQLEVVATCSPSMLQAELSFLVLKAHDCQQLAQLLHQEEFHAKQKAEMAATAS